MSAARGGVYVDHMKTQLHAVMIVCLPTKWEALTSIL
jgi:hypothetical protein